MASALNKPGGEKAPITIEQGPRPSIPEFIGRTNTMAVDQKLVMDKGKITPQVTPKMETTVEDAPPVAPKNIIFDRDKLYAEEDKPELPKPRVISAQTKMEMEAGKLALRRLQGIE